jgi:DNA-binding transcriptional regulator LsrR (DeoR family)
MKKTFHQKKNARSETCRGGEAMAKGAASVAGDPDDAEMAARAAWLHYAGGMTQSAIAARFGIPTTRAHRMIARAARDGLVRVFVDARVAGCVELEQKLSSLFGLTRCAVAPDLAEAAADGAPLRALGLAGASLLMGLIERGDAPLIGVGHGGTLAAAVAAMPVVDARGARFVSLLGGLTRRFAANPYDVIHKLAEKTGAEAYLMPAPMFANSPADRAMLCAQAGLGEIMRLIDEASVCLLGVGAVDMAGSIARADVFDPQTTLEALRERGARAEVLGQFLDADGQPMSTPYDGRVMAPALDALRGRDVHAIAGGPTKARALDAALRSGVFSGLITDEATARRLVERAEARPPDRRTGRQTSRLTNRS